MPVLSEGPPGQLQPEAARLSGPQHEVRPVPAEGEGGQGAGPEGGPSGTPRHPIPAQVLAQLGGNPPETSFFFFGAAALLVAGFF